MTPRRSPEPRTRRSGPLLLAAVLALAGLLWAGRAELPAHLARWSGSGARIGGMVDVTRLAPTLDASALARLLGLPALPCQPLADGSVCETALARNSGADAALVRATWQGRHLQTVEILVPWWRHHAVFGLLTQRLGAPSGNTVAPPGGLRQAVMAWSLPQGTVQFARAPGWNPWHWSRLLWRAADASAHEVPAEIRPAW